MLLFSAYRCRSCHARFHRLTGGLWIGAGALLLLTTAAGFGWGVSVIFSSERSQAPLASPVEPVAPPADAAPIIQPAVAASDFTASSAEAGDAKAQFQLGMAFRDGQTGARDLARASQWLTKAAEQGHADAQYVLGAMHLAGDGVLQSFPTAFEWFERAAQQNHAEAQFHLGRMYRRGYGVAASPTKAYVWFNLAAAQGHGKAREARDNLLPLMTPEQINAAQREAQQWRPTSPKPE
jgi:hypothetical protein